MSISSAQRQRISERASYRCEYCLVHQEYSIKSHHCDHIIPRKHGGDDSDDNLAWACFLCNGSKGSEVAAYDPQTGQLYSVFNPRHDNWNDHFYIEDGSIFAYTAVGRVTILVLQLNRHDKLQVRQVLSEGDLYP